MKSNMFTIVRLLDERLIRQLLCPNISKVLLLCSYENIAMDFARDSSSQVQFDPLSLTLLLHVHRFFLSNRHNPLTYTNNRRSLFSRLKINQYFLFSANSFVCTMHKRRHIHTKRNRCMVSSTLNATPSLSELFLIFRIEGYATSFIAFSLLLVY